MNGFDIGLLTVLGLLAFVGLLKGMTRILVGIGALIAAFLLASQFHGALADQLAFTGWPAELRSLIGYLGLFFGTMIAGALLGWLLRKLLKVAMLSWADRLAGAGLGLVGGLLVAALIVLPLVAYAPGGAGLLERSTLAPYVMFCADLAAAAVPRELSDRYRTRVADLRRHWEERITGIERENPEDDRAEAI